MVTGQAEEQCGYTSVEHGALFVIISGIYLTLEWCVDNWDMAVKVEQLHDQLICSATTVKTLNVGGRTMLQQYGHFCQISRMNWLLRIFFMKTCQHGYTHCS